MRRLVMTLAIVLTATLCSATIINVPGDTALIQDAINSSSNGDTVLVQPNTYAERINFNGKNIILASLYLTTGDTAYISSTIIDPPSNAAVRIQNGEDTTTTLIGFTITGGSSREGGGIVIKMNASPRIIHNRIINNNSYPWQNSGGVGAGLNIYANGYAYIAYNLISGNYCHMVDLVGGDGGGYTLLRLSDN